MTQLKYSFVVPVFNEQDNIQQLHQEILQVARQLTAKSGAKAASKKPSANSTTPAFEIIFIDDGSRDNTPAVLRQLKPARILTLRRNSGQTAALDAGFKAAKGEIIISLDGDLQNDPANVPALLQHLHNNQLDVVCGWRRHRRDSAAKRFISAGARALRNLLIRDHVHDAGCTLRVYRRECFDGMSLRGELHRFIPALLVWRGFKVGELAVSHRSRIHGQSKYTLTRTIKGLMDMLTLWFFHKFASRPLHMLGALGILSSLVGTGIGIWMFIERVFLNQGISNRIWPLIAVFLVLFGEQIFISGLIMDLIIRAYNPKFYEVQADHENS
jgi:glycosyltransferase involved in cell wall biosynthesis